MGMISYPVSMKTTVSERGQIVIPKQIRARLGLAPGQVLECWEERGRLVAAKAAMVLMGKEKATYTPFLDTGDHVIVINAAQIDLSGRKETDKLYRHHTGFLGNLKSASAGEMREKHPERLVEEAFAVEGGDD